MIEDYLNQLKIEPDVFQSWKQFLFCHCSSRVCIANKNFEEGCEWLTQAMHHWLAIYEGQNNAWLIPAMKTVAFNLVDLAIRADGISEVTDPHLSAHKHVGQTCRNLNSEIVCLQSFGARGSLEAAFAVICRSGKKGSGLAVSNALCKLYFKLDEIQMAAVFQTRVDSQLTLSFDEFPRQDRVTWKYYTGLIAMERLKFREAEECLTCALEQSNRDAARNIQKILFLLIPVPPFHS